MCVCVCVCVRLCVSLCVLIINSANNLFTWGLSAFAFFKGFLFLKMT